MEHRRARVVLGFVVAALWLPAIGLFMDWYSGVWARASTLLSVPLTVFVAVPIYLVVRKRISFLICAFAGVGIGALGALPWALDGNTRAAMNLAPILMVVGFISSILFWLIAVWKNGPRTT